jgi:probable HAF family extracellular repeat protein
MQDLGTLGGENSAAEAINESGLIADLSDLAQSGVTHAVLWTAPNKIQDLGTLGGTYSIAAGINNSGIVVGWASLP